MGGLCALTAGRCVALLQHRLSLLHELAARRLEARLARLRLADLGVERLLERSLAAAVYDSRRGDVQPPVHLSRRAHMSKLTASHSTDKSAPLPGPVHRHSGWLRHNAPDQLVQDLRRRLSATHGLQPVHALRELLLSVGRLSKRRARGVFVSGAGRFCRLSEATVLRTAVRPCARKQRRVRRRAPTHRQEKHTAVSAN